MHIIRYSALACSLLNTVLSNAIPPNPNSLQKRQNPAPGPLTTVQADGDGHAKNDLKIEVTDDNAEKAFNDFLHKGQCQAAPSQPTTPRRDLSLEKRVPNVIECLINDFQATLNEFVLNGLLAGLRDSALQVARTFPRPSFADQNFGEAFGQAVALAADRVPEVFPNIAQEQIGPTTIFIFFIAVAEYGQTFMQARKLYLQTKSLLTDKEFSLVCPKQGSTFYPKCDRLLCQGKDGKCTTDLMKPCGCDSGDKKDTGCSKDVKDMPRCKDCDGKTGKCGSGDKKDCECFGNTKIYVSGTVDWAKALNQILMEVGEGKPGMDEPVTSPECNKDEVSRVLRTTFRGDADGKVGAGVYKGFCDEVNKDKKKELKILVNQEGVDITEKKLGTRGIQKRTPPALPDPNGKTFVLGWTGGDDSCSSGCIEAFNTMTENPCAKLGPEQNNMAKSQKLDTGCGTYSYSVEPPGGPVNSIGPIPKVPQPKPINCKNAEMYLKDCPASIDGKNLDQTIDHFNVQLPGGENKVTSKMNNVTQVWRAKGGTSGPTYMVNIGWVPGCTDYKEMVADNPQGKSGDNPDQSISCTTIFKNVYDWCNKDNDDRKGNHGLGGYVDYGCLRYGFYPTQVENVWAEPPHPENYWNAGESFCPQKFWNSGVLKGCPYLDC